MDRATAASLGAADALAAASADAGAQRIGGGVGLPAWGRRHTRAGARGSRAVAPRWGPQPSRAAAPGAAALARGPRAAALRGAARRVGRAHGRVARAAAGALPAHALGQLLTARHDQPERLPAVSAPRGAALPDRA